MKKKKNRKFFITFFHIKSVQDLCICFNALVLLIMLINTYMFQAGLMGFMIGKFKSVWFLTIIYLGLCLGIQIWLVVNTLLRLVIIIIIFKIFLKS